MGDLAEDILALVQTPSVTGDETELADLLERRLRRGPASAGYRLTRLEDSLVLFPAARDPASSRPSDRPLVVLAGHIDTVPRGEAPDPEVRDDRVIGRGASDMKAGVAVMLALAEQIPAEAGFADRAFVFYTGEEGSAAGNSLARILEGEGWLRKADLAILLEPTNGALELGCNGSIHVRVVFRGRACHSARPWKGIHPMSHALAWFEQRLRDPIRVVEVEGVVFREVVSLTTIHAGDARNVIPGSMEVNLNLRYPPDRSPEDAEALALSLCLETPTLAGEASPGEEKVTAAILDHSPAGKIDVAAPLYRHLCESTGLPRRGKQGWTDVARFTSAGVPALNWGPGDPEMAHTADEFVELESARQCFEEMKAFFLGPGPGG
jgi:succinyl-diaminopimelate desuccinylase